MSRRSSFSSKRSGGRFNTLPSGTLPRAQERVQQEIERQGFDLTDGAWGDSPTSAVFDADEFTQRRFEPSVPTERRFGLRARMSRAFARGFVQLKKLGFRNPGIVVDCARRKVRREVLFSRRVAGRRRSPGRGGTYRRREVSNWRC